MISGKRRTPGDRADEDPGTADPDAVRCAP